MGRFGLLNKRQTLSLGSLAVVSGEVQLSFFSIPVAVPYIKSGKLRAMGVTSAQRNAALPEVPTIAESAIPGYEATNWYAILAPAGVPKPIVDKLYTDVLKAMKDAEVMKAIANEGADPQGTSPEEFAKIMVGETEKWGAVVKASGAKAE